MTTFEEAMAANDAINQRADKYIAQNYDNLSKLYLKYVIICKEMERIEKALKTKTDLTENDYRMYARRMLELTAMKEELDKERGNLSLKQ